MQISPAELRINCTKSYAVFAMLMQEDGWFDPVHARLCNFIQNAIEEDGEKDTNLLIIMPRGSLKSTIVTKYLPIWFTLRDNTFRTLIASNTAPNAARKVEDIRSVFDNDDLFKVMFPELLPTKDQRWTNANACVRRDKDFPEATFESAGVKTKVIGRHYNCIVEDDTMAPDNSDMHMESDNVVLLPSRESMERAIGWHKLAHPLLTPKGKRVRVVVTTRWADEDLVHYVKKYETYRVFDVPAETPDGQIVFTNFYSREELDELKKKVGSYLYSCLYLNKPIPPSERTFREEWFHEVSPAMLPSDGEVVISIDPAISKEDSACETAIIRCIHKKPLIYVTHTIHGKFSPMDTVTKALDLVDMDYEHTTAILCEANAFQKALVYSLQDEMRRRRIYKTISEVFTKTNKELRIQALQPLFERGQIIFVEGLDGVLQSQLIQFPYGRLIDVADALATQLTSYVGVDVHKEETKVRSTIGERLAKWKGFSYEEILGDLLPKKGNNYPRPTLASPFNRTTSLNTTIKSLVSEANR